LLLGAIKAGKPGAVCGAASAGASVSKVGIGDLHGTSLWLALRLGSCEQEEKQLDRSDPETPATS
jgi:hypothetical protein